MSYSTAKRLQGASSDQNQIPVLIELLRGEKKSTLRQVCHSKSQTKVEQRRPGPKVQKPVLLPSGNSENRNATKVKKNKPRKKKTAVREKIALLKLNTCHRKKRLYET